MKLVIASNNAHKLQEIREIIGNRYELVGLNEIGCFEDIPETGETLEINALQKSNYIYSNYKLSCFADDTGLEVDALNGEPGVYSARYAGEERLASNNIKKLLTNLRGVSNRDAQFRTVISLILEGKEYQFEGVVRGAISDDVRGDKGFGYDPIFVPNGYSQSFAEMSESIKNDISHRALAVNKLVNFLNTK